MGIAAVQSLYNIHRDCRVPGNFVLLRKKQKANHHTVPNRTVPIHPVSHPLHTRCGRPFSLFVAQGHTLCFLSSPSTPAVKQTFFIRVAAIGDVAAQQVNPTGDPPDNTNWSGVIEVVPADQPPSSPGPVSLYVLDGSTLQVTTKMLPHTKIVRTKTPAEYYV